MAQMKNTRTAGTWGRRKRSQTASTCVTKTKMKKPQRAWKTDTNVRGFRPTSRVSGWPLRKMR